MPTLLERVNAWPTTGKAVGALAAGGLAFATLYHWSEGALGKAIDNLSRSGASGSGASGAVAEYGAPVADFLGVTGGVVAGWKGSIKGTVAAAAVSVIPEVLRVTSDVAYTFGEFGRDAAENGLAVGTAAGLARLVSYGLSKSGTPTTPTPGP